MDLNISSEGLTLASVTNRPTYSSSRLQNFNFSGFCMTPWFDVTAFARLSDRLIWLSHWQSISPQLTDHPALLVVCPPHSTDLSPWPWLQGGPRGLAHLQPLKQGHCLLQCQLITLHHEFFLPVQICQPCYELGQEHVVLTGDPVLTSTMNPEVPLTSTLRIGMRTILLYTKQSKISNCFLNI